MKHKIILFFILSISIFGHAQYQYVDLHNFKPSQGTFPIGAVIPGGKMLYGMTGFGGAHNYGSVYSLDTNGNNFKDLLDFNDVGSPQGGDPSGALTLSGKKLFGMTRTGDTHNVGNVFSMDTDGTNYKDLVDFNFNSSPYGGDAIGSVIISGRTLYGMTSQGGTGYGCIFSVDTDGTGYTDLYNFTGGLGGQYPYGSLVHSGNELFGMTEGGGTSGAGLVFCIHTDGTSWNIILELSTLSGEYPYGSLILSGSMLFGMTYEGGVFEGEVFCVDTNGHHAKDLHNFTGGPAGFPMYTQLAISGSTLFGMTGDYASTGCIFSIDTNGSGYNVIYSFLTPFGSNPMGPLMLSGNRMYGTTYKGGTADSGVVFKFKQCIMGATIAVNSNVSCHGDIDGSATATPTAGKAPYTYSWLTSPTQTNATATGLKVGTYTVAVYDSAGCMTILTATITQPTTLGDSMFSMCAGCCNCHGVAWDSVYGGTKSYTYLWAPGGQTTDTITGLASGSYTCTVTDANGCAHRDTVWVTSGAPVAASSQNISCFGLNNGSASMSVSGNYSYSWAPGGQTTSSISGLSAGTYSVTVTNKDTMACGAMKVFIINQPPKLTDSIYTYGFPCDPTPQFNSIAAGGTLPYTYNWTNGCCGATITAYVSCFPDPETEQLILTDANGCIANSNIISFITPLEIDIPSWTNVSCYGGDNGSITIPGICGGPLPYITYTVTLLPPNINGYPNSGSFPFTFTNIAAGTYTIVAGAGGGCGNINPVTVIITQPAALSIVSDSMSDNGGCNGVAWVSVTDGTPGYTYSWTGGSTADSIYNQCAGNYCCVITDANGCIDSSCITIDLFTGIQSPTNGRGIEVSPNPSNGKFTLLLSGTSAQWSVEVYDVLGEKVYTSLQPQTPIRAMSEIDLRNQPSGVYFYRVKDESGNLIENGKLIIQK